MSEIKRPIPARLYNAAQGGHVAGANDIFDDDLDRNQAQINADTYRKSETYSAEQINNIVASTSQEFVTVDSYSELPAEGEAHTLYRVASWDGTQIDTTKYAEYAWDGTEFVLMDVKSPGIDEVPTVGSSNLIESGGVYSAIAKLGVSDNVLLNEYVAEIYVSSGADITQIDFAIASPGSGGHVGEYLNLFRLRTANNQSYHLFFSPTYYETQSAALTAWEAAFSERVIFNVRHTFGVAFTGKPFAQVSQIAATPTNSDMSNLSTMPLLKGYLLPESGENITDNVEFNRYVKELIVTKPLQSSTVKLKVGLLTGFYSGSYYYNIVRIYEYDSSDNMTYFDVYKESYDTLENALANTPEGVYKGTYGSVLFGSTHSELYLGPFEINHPLTVDFAPSLKAEKLEVEIDKIVTGFLVNETLEDIDDTEYKFVTVEECVEGERYETAVNLTFEEEPAEGEDDEVIANVYVRYYPEIEGVPVTKTLVSTTITRGNTSTSIIFQPVMSLPHRVIVKNVSGQTFDAEVTVKKQDTPIEVATPFKILYIGSSLGLNSVQYAPPILLNMGVTNYVVGYAFKGGCELSETLAALNGDTSILYEYRKWNAGSVAWDITPADPQNPDDLNYIANILADEEWDCIVISQAAHLIYGDYDTYFAPYIHDVCYKIYSLVNYSVRLCWNAICAGYIDLTSTFSAQSQLLEDRWKAIISNTQRVVAETPVNFVFASGTAIQNARNTSLNTSGFEGHLLSDTVHLNDGLPKFVIGYYTAIKLLELMGESKRSIIGDKLPFNNRRFLTTYNTGLWGRGINGETGYDGRTYPYYAPVSASDRYIGQMCAVAAVKNPYGASEEDIRIIDSTPKTSSFTALVGTYYTVNIAASSNVTITLATPSGSEPIKDAIFHVTTNTSPTLNFSAANNIDIYVDSGYSIEANKTYEIKAVWNRGSWNILPYKKL